MFPINTILQTAAYDIMRNSSVSFLQINAKIYSQENTDLSIVPYRLDALIIEQMFSNNYTDSVRVAFELLPEEIMSLVNNYKDLRLSLECYYVGSKDNITIGDPFTFEYLIVLNKPNDLIKQYNLNEILKVDEDIPDKDYLLSKRLPITLELFTEKAYTLRHEEITFMVRNTTIEGLLLYITSMFELDKAEIVTPDNTRTYPEMFIPPMQDISTIFDLIQNNYGIYGKGMSYYIANDGTFYMYPVSETDPETDRIVHLYSVPNNAFVGLDSYHYETDDNQVYILSNKEVSIENLGELSVENNGSSTISLRSDNVLDLNRDLSNGNDGTFKEDNLLKVSLDSTNKAGTDVSNVKYTTSSNNIFKLASKIAEENITMLGLHWELAIPYILTPGMKVYYHYETVEGVEISTGVLDSVIYQMNTVSTTGTTKYAFTASIIARLDSTNNNL